MLHGIPFSGNTTHRRDFTPKHVDPQAQYKTPNNLKTGEPWIGSSTYRDNFVKPNKTYDSGWKSHLSHIPDPKDPNQFSTLAST